MHPDPVGPPPKPGKSAAALAAQGASADAVETSRQAAVLAAAAAEQARIDKAKADEASHRAKAAEREAKLAKEDVDRLAAARKHLRAATPDAPIALRRVELANVVGDTLYGTPRNVIDLRNSEYANKVTLLFDGQICHVINAAEPVKSFWIGLGNIAAMYPRLDT